MDQPAGSQSLAPYVVIAGYGLPGRTLVEVLTRRKTDYIVIELNPQTCERATAGGVQMIAGSASDPDVLNRAGVDRATLIALMVPNDEVVLAAIPHIRRVNSTAHIIARCSFTSTGLEAVRRGASESIVAEQVIARELEAITSPWLPPL
jgi:Trk K+ transport system NAD-binding subunit